MIGIALITIFIILSAIELWYRIQVNKLEKAIKKETIKFFKENNNVVVPWNDAIPLRFNKETMKRIDRFNRDVMIISILRSKE